MRPPLRCSRVAATSSTAQSPTLLTQGVRVPLALKSRRETHITALASSRRNRHVASEATLSAAASTSDACGKWSDAVRVYKVMAAFRRQGHFAAQLDPLRGSVHRRLSPLEPISWRIGGRLGDPIDRIDINMVLRDFPDRLDLSVFGLAGYRENDLLPDGVDVPAAWGPGPCNGAWTFRSFVDHLRKAYCGTLGVEYQHIDCAFERRWLQDRLESRAAGDSLGVNSAERQRKALLRLTQAHQLERLFGAKYPKAKRFGLSGCEALLPGLWTLLESSAGLGVKSVQLGMAHRGRLNVLVNVMGKRVSEVCSEFGEQVDFLGDMKYHLGTTCTQDIQGQKLHLTLAPNPSHLEAVDPVVLGMTRAKQDYAGDFEMRKSMAVILHGDAAFSGQGIVSECMQLAALPAYTTGGTVHIVINNMVGFTTDPRAARSSYHCTNVAKLTDAPIFHVNADDVDAVLFAASVAAQYRYEFGKDVVIDIVGYRREGHSELEDASLTQPLTWSAIQQHPPVAQKYAAQLVQAGVVTQEEVEAQEEDVYGAFEGEYDYSSIYVPSMADWQVKEWMRRPVNVPGLPETRLALIGEALCRIPEGFRAHKTVEKLFLGRLRQIKEGRVDWALAEQLALGSLLLNFDPGDRLTTGLIEGSELAAGVDRYVVHPPVHVRLSGQDVERGTFNQRHSVIYDQETAVSHHIFKDLGMGSQSTAVVCNSSLSELAIMGFEYGYSLEEGLALTIWEAQFGDFANCAQTIIDNFIASGESKWGAKSCLVLSLPHGYEGQGPEHSSARVERFLQLIDDDSDDLWPEIRGDTRVDSTWEGAFGKENNLRRLEAIEAVQGAMDAILSGSDVDLARAMRNVALVQETYDFFFNMTVVNITTPANLFHVLRRQVHRTFAKPLILLSAKYLFHHRPCRSPLSDMGANTRFQRVIMEGCAGDNMPQRSTPSGPCRRLIFCSGKVFYELYHARAARKMDGCVALARLEQIAPFPSMEVVICAKRYPDAEIIWVQEEPKNMGAWSYVAPRFATAMRQLSTEADGRIVRYIGRAPAANPATPLFKRHKREVRMILDEALAPL